MTFVLARKSVGTQGVPGRQRKRFRSGASAPRGYPVPLRGTECRWASLMLLRGNNCFTGDVLRFDDANILGYIVDNYEQKWPLLVAYCNLLELSPRYFRLTD